MSISVVARLARTAAGLMALGWAGVAAAADKPAPDLLKLRDAYAAALQAGDAQAATKLTYFPMDNTVWQDKPIVGKAGFIKAFHKDASTAKCFKTEAFESEHQKSATGVSTWSINCDGNVYHFGQRKGAWYLTGYENINE